jgi:hypothetical protein
MPVFLLGNCDLMMVSGKAVKGEDDALHNAKGV